MSLDVHLKRSTNVSWGFRLVGGADSDIPLTIVKVSPSTPAETAGLLHGDKLVRLHGVPAEILTHEEADIIIRSCDEDIVMKIERGLYDMAIDDQEALFEPIDLQDDFVQQSEPTEVLPPLTLTPLFPIEPELNESQSRSLTASPFLVPTKPYRPFSTEPIPEVKPVEDPIILNPEFHDEFIKGLEDYLPKTKFKLPVSKLYDPYYGKEKREVNSNLNKESFYESKTSESTDYSQTFTAEELNQMKQVRIDIDLSKIEESNYTAQEFKTEEVISKESVDLKSTTSKSVDFASFTSKSYEENMNKESLKCETAKELVETGTTGENISKLEEIKKTAEVFVDEIIEQAKTVAGYIKDELEVDLKTEIKVENTKNIVNNETNTEKVHESVSSLKQKYEDQMTKDVAISQTKQDVVEVTEAGKVKNITSSFEIETDTKSNIKSDKKLEAKQRYTSFTESKKTQGSHSTTQSKTSAEHQKSLNEQKAYVLGLQTIPNIRGTIISSKHFDMLLKTFFIHLTDVMVALSRFILAEPAFTKEKLESNVENKAENFTREFITKEQFITKDYEESHIDKNETFKDRHERQFESLNESKVTDTDSEMKRKDKKKESNIKIALKSSETSEEVAHNMEAVLSEFQIKKGIEDINEDEVAMTEKTSNMTEMLDSENVLKSETRSESKFLEDTSTTKSENISKQRHEEQQERRTETGAKNTYIAIVESHVYTNKEATMEMAIKSADSSRKSSVEEIISKENEAFREAAETAQIEKKVEIAQVEEKFENVQIEEMMETTQVEENVQISQVEETQPVVSFAEEISNITTIVEESMQEEIMLLNTNENLKRVSVVEEIQGSQNITQSASVSIEEVVEKLESQILSSADEQTVSHEEQSKTIESENAELCLKKYQYVTEEAVTQQQINEQIISEQQTLVKQEQLMSISKQEQSFISKKELTETHKYDNTKLRLDLKTEKPKKHPSTTESTPSTIDTPTPSTIPPTPLTDEYIFRLEAPMPKNRGTPTPIPEKPIEPEEHEDPHIVKKKMIPHIDTNIERIVYDPPLLTPDVGSGLIFEERSFQERPVSREEIKEIERTSSLLASAIDQTIKSIEEYKEQAGMDSNKAMESISPPLLDVNTTNITNIPANSVAGVSLTPNIYSGTVQEAKTIVYSQPTIDIKKSSFTQAQESINISSEIDTTTTSEINGFRSVKFMPDNLEQTPDVCKIEGTMNSLNDKSIKMTITEEVISTDDKSAENMPTYKPVHFDPSEFKSAVSHTHFESLQETQIKSESTTTKTLIGTHQGIVDSLEEQIMDSDTAKELGKPGISEEKIAELISGEAEMLREAHVMGLKRVLNAHMHKTDDENSSVDFMKIKPSIDGLRDSEVLKALNEELIQKKVEEKKKEEKDKGTTFLQKPKRPVPKAKHGYHGWMPEYENLGEPYKVKIVKQPKPKVAPDYKPEVFETGPLPWEERAANEPPPPPVLPEDPILVPEEGPQFLEAVDPLPESEVPDLEDTGIQLPPEETVKEQDSSLHSEEPADDQQPEVFDIEKVIEETEQILLEDMEEAKIAEQLMSDVQGMVDPKATLEQQLTQMRAQLAALAQLPCVIQQTLDLVTKQLSQLTQQGATEVVTESKTVVETTETVEVTEKLEKLEETKEEIEEIIQHQHVEEKTIESNDQAQDVKQDTAEEFMAECCRKQEKKECSIKQEKECSMKQEIRENKEKVRRETDEIMDEQRRIERSKKDLIEQLQQEHESRQLKQRPTPRVGKPKPVFGPLTPQERPLVLPGGRKWRKPADAYNEQFIAETLQAQAEIIQGKTMGSTFESNLLPYDERINFMKFEKPPISLDHLKDSDVYKMVHNMDQGPQRRVEMLTPVIAESDYREKCRAATPAVEKISR